MFWRNYGEGLAGLEQQTLEVERVQNLARRRLLLQRFGHLSVRLHKGTHLAGPLERLARALLSESQAEHAEQDEARTEQRKRAGLGNVR